MRLLHVVPSLGPGGMGDALVRHLRDLSAGWPDMVNDVAALRGGTRRPEITPYASHVFGPVDAQGLAALLESKTYDIIHWWRSTRDLIFREFLRRLPARRPAIVMTLCQIPVDPRLSPDLLECEYADRIVLICRHAYRKTIGIWAPEEACRMIYFGVEPVHLPPGSRRRTEGPFTFGRGSTLNKCPDNMMAIFSEIPIPGARFLIAGQGTPRTRRRLERRIAKNGLQGRVQLVGQLSRPQWLDFVRGLDIFLYQLPRKSYSAIDGTVQDAMLCEVPVVLLDAEGPSELVVHGKSGFIARNRYELIQYCCDLYKNADLRTAVGREGRRRIMSDFQREDTMAQYVKLYEECLMAHPVFLPDGRARRVNRAWKVRRGMDLAAFSPQWLTERVHAAGRRLLNL